MVVTAGAGDSQPEKSLTRNLDLFVHDVIKHLDLVLFGNELWTECEESGGDDAFDVDIVTGRRRQQVSGYLFTNELIEWFIPIECLDHIVPISPGMRVT